MENEKQQDKSSEPIQPQKEPGHGGLLMFERSAVDA